MSSSVSLQPVAKRANRPIVSIRVYDRTDREEVASSIDLNWFVHGGVESSSFSVVAPVASCSTE